MLINWTAFFFATLVSVTVPITNAAGHYGPSILSLVRPYPKQPIPLPFLLPAPVSPEERVVYLDQFLKYTTVLPISEHRTWIKSEDIVSYLGKDGVDNTVPFTVTPPKGHGIMVVIQELQIPALNTFNKSLLVIDENGMIVECFSSFVFQIEGKSPVQICGRTGDQESFRPSVLDGVGPRSFIVPPGKSVTVSFYYRDELIDKSAMLSKQVPIYDWGYLFRASIAFTAHKSCPNDLPTGDDGDTTREEKLWPCDIPQNSREPVGACIPTSLFCDGVINCGYHDSQEFGIDERFCRTAGTPLWAKDKILIPDADKIEEAIKTRLITERNRPFGYDDIIMGVHPSRPQPISGNGGNYHFSEPVDKFDSLDHPAFVALIVLISVICVLMIGLILRYCCKTCVGKPDPYGDSSNPEAVARFHENLRSRDTEANGRPGRNYRLSFDSIFKPASDDHPPSYDDLFPADTPNKLRTISERSDNNIPSQSLSSTSSSGNSEMVVAQRQNDSQQQSSMTTRSIFRLPAIIQQTSRTVNRSNSVRATSNHSNNSNSGRTDSGYFINPTFVDIEVVSGSGQNGSIRQSEGREGRRHSSGDGGGPRRSSCNNNNNFFSVISDDCNSMRLSGNLNEANRIH